MVQWVIEIERAQTNKYNASDNEMINKIQQSNEMKFVYKHFLDRVAEAPVAKQTTWTKELSETDRYIDRHCINTKAQKCSTETETVCFQIKFIHRLTTTNAFLRKIGRQEFELCTFSYNNIQSVMHIFSECTYTVK